MQITTQLDYKSYARLMIALAYKKILGKVVVFLGSCFFLLGVVILLFGGQEAPLWNTIGIIACGLVLILMPYLANTLRARRDFFSNEMLQEKIVYEFVGDTISLKGTSVSAEMKWHKMHKVQEVKDWYLLYQSKNLVNLIPKKALRGREAEFESIITSQKGLNYQLLKK